MSQRSRGVALITVMLVTALASVIVYNMLTRHHMAVAKTRQVVYSSQALNYALGAEAYARQILYADFEEESAPNGGGHVDSRADAWAEVMAPFEVEQGAIEIQITDLDGLFNLNWLASSGRTQRDYLARFKNLLIDLKLDPNVADAVADWVDKDLDINGFGAEDSQYLLQDPPYRAANANFASVSELRLLPGIDNDVYSALAPYVAALPSINGRININTVQAAVLRSISTTLDPGQMESIATGDQVYDNVQQLISEVPELAPHVRLLAVRSRFFRIRVRSSYAGQTVRMESIVHRNPTNGEMLLISREFGVRFITQLNDGEEPS